VLDSGGGVKLFIFILYVSIVIYSGPLEDGRDVPVWLDGVVI